MAPYEDSDSIEFYQDASGPRARIKPLAVFVEVFGGGLPDLYIDDALEQLGQHASRVARAKGLDVPSREALSNTRGYWMELIVALAAWNYTVRRGLQDLVIAKLPNVRTFDFRHLFDGPTREMLAKLEDTLSSTGHRMITSNPDLVIIKQADLPLPNVPRVPDVMTSEYLQTIMNLYTYLAGLCIWTSVRAGIGLKTSLRPDRRLQLVHEANIVKAIFAHLRNRHWERQMLFKYYGAAGEQVNQADLEALRTVATHSITDVNSHPEFAVDGLFSILRISDIDTMLDTIVGELR